MGFYVIVEILETGALMLISFVLLSRIQVSLKIFYNLGNPQGMSCVYSWFYLVIYTRTHTL